MLNRARLVATLLAATALAWPTPSRAVTTAPTSTFDFVGTCADCTGTAKAELILSNYTLGDTISAANFISFGYGGSNLLAPFTIVTTQASGLSGTISAPVPGTQDFSVTGNNEDFTSQANGFWCVGGSCYADFGFSSVWSAVPATVTPPDPASVPEPATLAVLAAALLGYAALRARTAPP